MTMAGNAVFVIELLHIRIRLYLFGSKKKSCPQCRHQKPPTIISNDQLSNCLRPNAKDILIKNAPFCSCLYIISFVLINLEYIYKPLMWLGVFLSNSTTLFLIHTVFDIRKMPVNT